MRTMAGGDLKCQPASGSSSGPCLGVGWERDNWGWAIGEGFRAEPLPGGRDAAGLVRWVKRRCLWREPGGAHPSGLLHQGQLKPGQGSLCQLHVGVSLPNKRVCVLEVWARL